MACWRARCSGISQGQKRRGRGVDARQVVEIHNSNSNLEMKHGKTVALMVSTCQACAAALLPLATDFL